MKVAWFTPVTGDDPVVDYSRGVLAAMAQLCEPLLCCNQRPERFPAEVRVVDLKAQPEAVSELRPVDAIFYNLGDDFRQYAWIFDMVERHPGIVVLHDASLHRFFLGYHLQHLHRADLYISRMAEHYGVAGLRAAQRVLGPRLDPESIRVDGADVVRYTFTEEVLRSARGVVVHSASHVAMVRRLWDGPVCEASLPAQRAAATSEAVQYYARDLLRFAEQDAYAADAEPLVVATLRPVAERLAIHIGETLFSLGARLDSPGVERVIREATSLLWPASG